MKSKYNPIVPAVDQACKVLLCLASNSEPKMSLTEICSRVGIHKSKGFSILKTLEKYGFVQKDPISKRYSLGLGLAYLGRKALDNVDYRDLVMRFLRDLAGETGHTAVFGLITGENFFIIAKHESMENLGITIRVGHRFHITSGAHGKAIISFLKEDRRAEILSKDKLYFYGSHEKFDRMALEKEMEECRKLGFAKDMGDLHPGIKAVSSPVFGPRGEVVGCIVLIGTFSVEEMDSFGARVVLSAREISLTLGGQPPFGKSMT